MVFKSVSYKQKNWKEVIKDGEMLLEFSSPFSHTETVKQGKRVLLDAYFEVGNKKEFFKLFS